jgi:hypothetical protein
MDARKNELLDHASLDRRSAHVRYGFFFKAQKSEVNDKEFCKTT